MSTALPTHWPHWQGNLDPDPWGLVWANRSDYPKGPSIHARRGGEGNLWDIYGPPGQPPEGSAWAPVGPKDCKWLPFEGLPFEGPLEDALRFADAAWPPE